VQFVKREEENAVRISRGRATGKKGSACGYLWCSGVAKLLERRETAMGVAALRICGMTRGRNDWGLKGETV
jgi:hypothetical protein